MRRAVITKEPDRKFKVVYTLDLWCRDEQYDSLETAMFAVNVFMDKGDVLSEAMAAFESPNALYDKQVE